MAEGPGLGFTSGVSHLDGTCGLAEAVDDMGCGLSG